MDRDIFRRLGLKNTYLDVPRDQVSNYAQGYTGAGAPIRMSPGPLAAEAYGIRTTASDMLRFVDAYMHMTNLDDTIWLAISESHVGYYRIGVMT
jgi:beta-lactamase class C